MSIAEEGKLEDKSKENETPPSPPPNLEERIKRLEENAEELKKAITGLTVVIETKSTEHTPLETSFERLMQTLNSLSEKIDRYLEKGERGEPMPPFDPEELMKHRWKGKRKKYGEGHETGSLAWGWDFKEEFSHDVLQVLERGPLQIGQYEFSIFEDRIVQTRKKE